EAIVAGARERGATLSPVAGFESLPGKGVSGTVAGRQVALGNAMMMAELGIDTAPLAAQVDALGDAGRTAVYVALDGRLAGLLAVADSIKPTTGEAIRALPAAGLRTIRATGDTERTARAVAQALGIDEVRAGVLPEDKRGLIEQLRAEGHAVAMAGDGVNDAPALAAADV